MNRWNKIAFSALFLGFWGVGEVSAQSDQRKPNRLSIGIMGAVTTGHLDFGSAFQSSVDANFEFQERLNNSLGFNIRYVATPEIALQTNVVFGKFSILSDIFPDDALTFDNNYIATSITTQLGLVRILGASAQNINLFGSFGAGFLLNDVSIHSQNPAIKGSNVTPSDHPFQTFFATFGGGIRFNLSDRIDSFAQYEYSSASRDIIDGNFIGNLLNLGESSKISNSWSAVSFGVQFKFGSRNMDADWPVASRVSAPDPPAERDMFERLEELLARQAETFREEIHQLTGRIDSLKLALLEEKRLNQQPAEEQHNTFQNEEMAGQIRELQQQVAQLENALAAERAKDEELPTIAEQHDDTADTEERTEHPKTKTIHRVRIQGEMIIEKQKPNPLPVEIVLVPDLPEGGDSKTIAEIVQELQQNQSMLAAVDPKPENIKKTAIEVQTVADVSLKKRGIEPDLLNAAISKTTPESDIFDEVPPHKTAEQEQENVFQKADSLIVIKAIEELDSTRPEMVHVRNDVKQPDTTELIIPKPEDEEPEFPKPEYKQQKPEQDRPSNNIASADVASDISDILYEVDKPIVQADTDTTNDMMNQPQVEEEATQPLDATAPLGDKGLTWTWYALIAVAILGAVYFVANIYRPKSSSDSV